MDGFISLKPSLGARFFAVLIVVSSVCGPLLKASEPEVAPLTLRLTPSQRRALVEKTAAGLLDRRDPRTHLPSSHRGQPAQENVLFLYDLAHNAMELHLAG